MSEDRQEAKGMLGWYQRTNKKLLFGIAVIVVAMGALMGTSLRGALTYYKTVDELQSEGEDAVGQRVRVGGRVQEGSIVKDANNNLRFVIYHNERSTSLSIQYRGVVPDIFGGEVDVIVEGRKRANGVFYATNLLAQHPPEFKVVESGKPHNPVEDRNYKEPDD